MNKKHQTKSHSTRTHFQKLLLTHRSGRLTALIVFAVAAAAMAIGTLSLAQTDKNVFREGSAAKPATAIRVPGKSARARTTSSKSKGRSARFDQQEQDKNLQNSQEEARGRGRGDGRPKEWRLRKARTFTGDLRELPHDKPVKAERPERELPELNPTLFVPPGGKAPDQNEVTAPQAPANLSAPAPPPNTNFEGLSFNLNGNGHPPDTVGDVGPNHYIQAINTSLGVYDKAGNKLASFTFNTLMSQGAFGNLCDTNNFGDPVVLYDTFEDRWVVTDFAFQLSGGAVVSPPGAYQCFAVSRSGDPVAGGWNFYSLHITDFLNDYPKFGIWPDGIYMSANMFAFPAGGAFQGARAWVLNKAQMYAGAASIQSVSFNVPGSDATVIPSNARLQTGTPPPGTPNYFLSTSSFLNALSVYKFHVDWNKISTSTFTGPDLPIASTSWPNLTAPSALSLGGNNLDVLATRAMMQTQYTNLGGVESLWASHTVRRGNTSGLAAPRFYQVPITGGTVGANITQAATFDPDGANVISRFMPSVGVDRAGNMAIGYSTSSATTKPAIKYAGRLATDPINTFSQTEQVLIQGAGTQTGNCGGAPCTRWGDYSAMTLDPDGCTFWYTNMYYPVDGLDHHTRIGSFNLPQCTTIGNGSVQGTVTSSSGGGPINGATVALGSRTATTDSSGFYSIPNLPAGTYPNISASFPGYTSSSVNSVVVNEGAITSENFVLSPGANSACFTDTTQADFQTGVPTNVDLNSTPGDVKLVSPDNLDQQQLNSSGSGIGFNNTTWVGQTFVPSVSGSLTRVDLSLFCSGCSGINQPITIEVRTTSAGLPTNTVLATTTIPGFSSGASAFYPATFSSPAALTAGTTYAYTMRLVTNRTGTYAAIFSSTAGAYANGTRVSSSNSGGTWTIPLSNTTPPTTATPRDLAFRTFMNVGFASSGNLISGAKDANPHVGGTVTWTTLSWNAATPAGTEVKFQVAGSNSAYGPFNFVGPNGTAATFFTSSGASLAQFNGLRYLKYQAFLTTSSSSSTPVLNDVTVCYSNTVPTALTTSSASGSYGGTVNLSATLTDGVSPLSGKTIDFSLNGNSAGSAVTDGSGVASLSNVSLTGINAGTYPTGVGASFAGDAPYLASNATNSLIVGQVSPAFSNLSSPTIECSTPNTTLSGTIMFGGLVPSGSVAITLNGVTQNATIQADGSFSSSFATGSLTPVGSPFTITYFYPGDVNFGSANGGGTLTIVDTSVPTITLNGNTISLWPVNKSYRTVNVADLVAGASDGCDSSVNLNSVVISKVTSDEGASTSGDILIAADCKSVQLRQDRNGNGNGRVYTITFRVRDSWGNTTTTTAKVTVPHDQGSGSIAVDSGVAYTINGTCP